MKSKTLNLIENYMLTLNEQDGQDPSQQPQEQQPEDVQDAVDPNAQSQEQETMPLTSQGEEAYISNLVDAALYEPSPEEARTLLNLQNVIQLKRFKNAREEILPLVLSIISSKTGEGKLSKNLSQI